MRRRDVIQALCGLLGVLLARLHVAGTAYYDAEAVADRLRPGQRLALRRQPENRYDALAIEVLGPEGHKLGYVPRRRNEMPARLMDAGKRLSARAESIAQRGSWLNIQVSLYLDDAPARRLLLLGRPAEVGTTRPAHLPPARLAPRQARA